MRNNGFLENQGDDMKTLTIKFDVTGMTDEEIDGLTLEAVVQGESSENHPDAPVISTDVEEVAETRDELASELRALVDRQGPTTETLEKSDEILTGIGRGPNGKLRNFRQMGLEKFLNVYESVMDEARDDEAMDAVAAEYEQRGLTRD